MRAVIYSLAGVLIVAGVIVAIASFLSPGQVIHGINAGLAGILLAGGAVTLGLAGLTEAVEAFGQALSRTLRLMEARSTLEPESSQVGAQPMGEETAAPFVAAGLEVESPPREEETVAAEREVSGEETIAAAAEASETPEAPAESPPDRLAGAFRDTVQETPDETVAAAAVVEEVTVTETPSPPEAEGETPSEELYVVQEREFRGKPARVLSDGTVEAETDEGWMRFENMEHLEEYMDAMAEQRK